MTRQTKQAPRELEPDVISGFERRAELGSIPPAKLQEIIELRAIIRALVGHINHLEEVPATT